MFFRICGSPDSKPDDQQPAPAIRHGLQSLIVRVRARRARPLEANWLKLLAERQHAVLADVERIVVEEKFLRLGKHLVRLPEFPGYAFHRSHAPRMAGKRLRPQAERAKRRASARGVERNEGIQQERHIVFLDRQILLVYLGGKWQFVEFLRLHQRPRRVVYDLAILHVARVLNFRKRLALRVLHNGMVEFPAHHEINIRARQKAFRGFDLHMRPNESNFQIRASSPSSRGPCAGRCEIPPST